MKFCVYSVTAVCHFSLWEMSQLFTDRSWEERFYNFREREGECVLTTLIFQEHNTINRS